MTLAQLDTAVKLLPPILSLVSDAGSLISGIASGAVSFGVATAQIRSILLMANERLNVIEQGDKVRDEEHEKRIKDLQDKAKAGVLFDRSDEPTKP